ncbi:aminotransferase class IV, partial [Caulobacter sp. HMWF009]
VTRSTLLEVIREAGLPISEQPFTIAEAQSAREAFITGAGTLVMPIVSVDGVALGDGKPGPVATRLRKLYVQKATEKAC